MAEGKVLGSCRHICIEFSDALTKGTYLHEFAIHSVVAMVRAMPFGGLARWVVILHQIEGVVAGGAIKIALAFQRRQLQFRPQCIHPLNNFLLKGGIHCRRIFRAGRTARRSEGGRPNQRGIPE